MTAERRTSPRGAPPVNEQLLTIHADRRHAFGRIVDESDGGIGVRLAEAVSFEIGESVLVHRLNPHRLRLGIVRHVLHPAQRGTRLGLEWNDAY